MTQPTSSEPEETKDPETPDESSPDLLERAIEELTVEPSGWRRAGAELRRVARSWPGRILGALLVLLVVAGVWAVWPFVRAGGAIGDGPESQPSRLWGAPIYATSGDRLSLADLAATLAELGYRSDDATASHEADEADEPQEPDEARVRWPPVRTYRVDGDRLLLHLPARIGPEGAVDAIRFAVEPSDADPDTLTIRRVRRRLLDLPRGDEASSGADGEIGPEVDQPIFLGAPLLGSYYGDDVREILPVDLDELPDHVVDAVLAAEDQGFYLHLGLSPSGIARALWVNARAGEMRQGGSTITQQLVKNVFLTHERNLSRKVREAVLSVLVELSYSKEQILQAYLNQIYLGTGHRLNIHGFGAAARHFFDVDARELTVAQAATLAGMIRAPAHHSPISEVDAAVERRDQVLAAMLENGTLDQAGLDAARAEPMRGVGVDLGRRFARYFAGAVADEARRRFGVSTLGNRGYHLFTTLSRADQVAAEDAVERVLRRLPARDRLEGALVSVDPRDGRVLAWVGGRDYGTSQFDRVRLAERQAGSTFKPVVLAAALESGTISPSSPLDDEPLTVDMDGRDWQPTNSDGRFRGRVTVRRAIEESLNVPIVRLARAVGLDAVRDTARALGVESRLETRPSMALGAFEVTPLELVRVYATLAADGRRPEIHGIAAIVGPDGDVAGGMLSGSGPAEPEPVLDPRVAAQTTSILQGVVTRGTARAARGVAGPVAGKTGTSNEARDNWFAAYRPDRVTVVWVGHDDPRPTPLSGARAALPIWAAYARAAYPDVDAPADDATAASLPEGLVRTEVCHESGLLPRPACRPVIAELFQDGRTPTTPCDVHVPGSRDDRRGDDSRSWFRRKLDDIFG